MKESEKLNFEAPSGIVSASLISTEKSTNEIAIVFPGAGYSCEMPLLYYSIEALLQKGYRVIAIEKVYANDSKWRGFQTRESAFKYVEEDTLKLFTQFAERFSDKVKLLLGRSLGTYQIACALESKAIRPRQIVWQTPSLYEKWSIINACGIPGFGIIGTFDERYETAIEHLPKDKIVVEGADHAMEIPGNARKSIAVLEQVINATEKWLFKAGTW